MRLYLFIYVYIIYFSKHMYTYAHLYVNVCAFKNTIDATFIGGSVHFTTLRYFAFKILLLRVLSDQR